MSGCFVLQAMTPNTGKGRVLDATKTRAGKRRDQGVLWPVARQADICAPNFFSFLYQVG